MTDAKLIWLAKDMKILFGRRLLCSIHGGLLRAIPTFSNQTFKSLKSLILKKSGYCNLSCFSGCRTHVLICAPSKCMIYSTSNNAHMLYFKNVYAQDVGVCNLCGLSLFVAKMSLFETWNCIKCGLCWANGWSKAVSRADLINLMPGLYKSCKIKFYSSWLATFYKQYIL